MKIQVLYLKQPSKYFDVWGGLLLGFVLLCFFFFLRCILVSVDIHVSSLKVFSVSYYRLLDLWKLGNLPSAYAINLDVGMISHDRLREV